MIYGDPYYFAVWMDCVDKWNKDSICQEGIFSIFIDGNMIPQRLPDKATFLPNSIRSVQTFLNNIESLENDKLFSMSYQSAYQFLDAVVHYQYQDIDEEEAYSYWKYCLTNYIDNPSEKDDIWYISSEMKEKLIYFNQNFDCIEELVLDRGYVKSVLGKVKK